MHNARLWAALWLLAAPAVGFAVPRTISVQAILTGATGQPVGNGTYQVTLTVYKSSTGGNPLWTETLAVTTQDGLFSTTLGLQAPIADSVVADTAAYLELTVENDPPMSPRIRLASAPYSLTSASVRGEGPVELEYEDVASGEVSTYSLSVTPEAGGTAGKNIRKNITVTLLTRSGATTESLDLDSGYMTTVHFQDGDDTLHQTEIVHLGGDPGLHAGQAVAIPAFMKNARKAKTAASAETRETLDTDSGFTSTVLLQSTSSTTEQSLSLAPPTAAAIAIPNLIEARKGSNSSASAESRLILDPDSGYAEVVTLEDADLSATMSHSMGHTREHVLLARQVGVPSGGTRTNLATLATNDDSASAQWRWAEAFVDTSDVEISVSGSEQSIVLSNTTTTAGKWPNIVLKRGLSSSEMRISHSGAGSSSVIYAAVTPALGGQLGINTATPSLAFQLNGSGCYTGSFGVCSDRRFKDHVSTLSDPLTRLRRLRGVNFMWRQEEFPDREFPSGQQIGLIAQEVEAVVPGVVTTGDDGYKSVDYAKLVPLLIEAVKAQQRQIDQLKARLDNSGRLTSAGN